MAAGGLGLLGASQGVLSNQDYNNLKAFQAAGQSWGDGQDPRQNLRQYIEYGHRAIAAKPFGIDGSGIMHGLRAPGTINAVSSVLDRVGMKDQSKFVRSVVLPEGGLKHYTEFAKSPLDGYRQLSEEYAYGGHGVPTGTAKNLNGMLNQNPFGRPSADRINSFLNWNKDAIDPNKLTPAGLEQQRNSVQSLMADTQPRFNLLPWQRTRPTVFSEDNPELGASYMRLLNKHIDGAAKAQGLDLAKATADQKRQVMNSLDTYIKAKDLNFWKQKQQNDYAMGTLMPGAGKMYGNIMAPFTGTHDMLKYTGIAAAAAGAGIGGYALYKMLRSHLAKKKLEQQPQVPQSY